MFPVLKDVIALLLMLMVVIVTKNAILKLQQVHFECKEQLRLLYIVSILLKHALFKYFAKI